MDKNLGDDTITNSGAVANLGTVGTNVVATEYGDGKNHITLLTLTAVAITVGDNASLGVGSLIYTFPAGVIHLHSTHGSLALTTGEATSDTPEMAIGTVIASGANATIAAVGETSQNLGGPVTLVDTGGTAALFVQRTVGDFIIAAADVHAVFLNFADAWANVTDLTSGTTGTVWLNWSLLA